ncbi:DUF21-domain-containing protein [Rhizopogon vinicolor AM-OR11-026]|uniref:DUF21-domain-containing protein n=1 Tax=Rhizopogon vinicolor AM-OR11-026 TaxID=1314800 RepID=A0A1B7MFH1_9AGAM|nr:DUF21-domain-containing protein [Rhizopogon vinicolor AM-OR11-026]
MPRPNGNKSPSPDLLFAFGLVLKSEGFVTPRIQYNVLASETLLGLSSSFFTMFVTIVRSLLMEPPETTGEPVDSPTFWWKIAISIILVLAGGVFAGLTLGLMGLDELHLRVLATSSEDLTEKRNAQKVLRLMQRGRHWVLVVLLLGNVVINESLPIFLDGALGGGIAAVVISTTAIVIFGEYVQRSMLNDST